MAKTDPTAADRAFVEGYAAAHGLRVEWEGEIGFGRECVGLLDGERDTYIAWTDATAPEGISDAYHKDNYIAVLGRGPAAEAQLAAWVKLLAARRATFERVDKEIPDLGTLIYGYTDELTAVAYRSRLTFSYSTP